MIQLQLIEKTRQLAEKDKNVSGVFMYGSFTKDEGDRYFDIEFYFFLKSKENFSAENWVGKIHSLALYFTNKHRTAIKRAFQKSIKLSEKLFTKLNIEPKINELLTRITAYYYSSRQSC